MVRIITLAKYKEFYDSKIKEIPHTPFQTYYWAKFHEKYFKDKFYFLYMEEDNHFKAGLVLFEASTAYGKLYYTYGRFGVSGLVLNPNGNHNDFIRIIGSFTDKILEYFEPHPLSVSIGNIQMGYQSEEEINGLKAFCGENVGKYFSRFNHIADVNSLTDDKRKLNFRDYNRRSNLSRNLRRAKEEGLSVSDQINADIIKRWHEVHLKRVSELKGKHWGLIFFLQALEMETDRFLRFFGVYENEKLVGGAFCFFNNHVLDIFMMSTLREYQKLGANHLLAEYIYLWCARKGIKYINWQGSNPPEGGTAKFKEQWMARKHIMHSVNLIGDQARFKEIDKEKLLQEFPDRFFYPFT
jgi:GNAT superfamily N-acetyltransferase